MNPKLLLVVIGALMLAAVAWSLLQQEGMPPVSRPGARAAEDGAAAKADAAAAGDAMRERGDGGAQVVEAASHRREAVASHESLLPLPDDVEWTPVRIVDAETREPIAGAQVRWYDGAVQQAITEQKLNDASDPTIWHDIEQLAARFGWLTTSDERGVARVHRSPGTQVVAREGARYGQLNCSEELVPPSGGFELELQPDFALHVQVVDAADQPAAGVPISIAVHGQDGAFVRPHMWGAVTVSAAPDGCARIAHTQALPELTRDGGRQHYRVRTSLPGFEDDGVAFDPAAPPSSPVVLRLPPTGAVKVRGEVGGEAVRLQHCTLQQHNTEREYRFMFHSGMTRSTDDDGWARFANVPLGKELQVNAYVNGNWLYETFDGPALVGAEVEVVLTPDGDAMMLTGRLVDERRAPLGGIEFMARVQGDVYHHSQHQSDEQGRFLIIVRGGGEQRNAEEIEFTFADDAGASLVGNAPPRELRAGVEDLGDVVLRPGALIVAGRCEVDGAPARLHAVVERESVAADGSSRWRYQRDANVVAREDGTFEVRGEVDGGRLRLRIHDAKCLQVEPVPFRRGQQDLLVQLERGAELAATMLVPDARWQVLEAKLERVTDPLMAGGSAAKSIEANVRGREGDRQQADWSALSAGRYTLSIGARCFGEPLHVVDDVVIPQPEGGDPRLLDIDLREKLRAQVVRLFDQDWKPLENVEGALFPIGQPETAVMQGLPCWGHEVNVLLPVGTKALLLGVSGYRPQRVTCNGEPVDVRLDPWPQSVVTVRSPVDLPDGVDMRVRLGHAAGGDRRWSAMWQSGRVDDLLGPPSHDADVENGRATLQVGDEARPLQLMVRREHKTEFVQLAEQSISLRDPTFTLQVDEAAMQKALDGLK